MRSVRRCSSSRTSSSLGAPTTRRIPSIATAAPRRNYAVGTDVTQFKSPIRDADGNVLATKDVFKGKRVVLLGVPGAFTPVCTNKHVPSFVDNQSAWKEHKVDSIVCVYV